MDDEFDDDIDHDASFEDESFEDEGSYVCGACGEEIVIPLDPSAGRHQEYVEDCPVCCRPNVINVDYDEEGRAHIGSGLE